MQECKLCKNVETLRISHVIPEFYYKSIYDIEKKRFYAISSDEDKWPKHHQKGLREKLLCDKCEGKLNKWETYFANLLFEKAKIRKEKGRFVVLDADYEKVKLHQISIIWRSGISQLDAFKFVKLGPHQEKMRKMILNEDPGDYYQYGCGLFVNMKFKDITQNILMPPEMKKYNSHRLYNFILGGLFWVYFISSHKPDVADVLFIKDDNELPIIIEYEFTSKFLHNYYKDLKKSGNLDKVIGFGSES
jgi:hypothetical protein